VVDKPFVVTVAHGEELAARASDAGVQLTVFQNRRWDADFLTLQKLLREGALGEVRTFESRFEWWRPEGFGNWRDSATLAEGGGILHDLGAHLIDQAIQLFGPVEQSYGETGTYGPHPDAADTEAFVSLLHVSGVRSRLWMNGMAAQVGPASMSWDPKPDTPSGDWTARNPRSRPASRRRTRPTATNPRSLGGFWEWTDQPRRSRRKRATTPGSTGNSQPHFAGHGRLPVQPAEALETLKIIENIHAFA
jgi:scyllo-inositol 2-dehydrogenase (NADP+)